MARTAISLDQAVDLARTGDIWIFRGRSAADRAIRTVTNAPVNHVGMAVVLDDLPPLMWHAELGKTLRDVWTGDYHRGVQLHDLREAVHQWQVGYGQQAWLRQLEPEIGARRRTGCCAPSPGSTASPSRARPSSPAAGCGGRTGHAGKREQARRDQRPEVAYCAEVVAATMVEMGMLDPGYAINWYDPGTFWSGEYLPLHDVWHLGDEIAVTAADPAAG